MAETPENVTFAIGFLIFTLRTERINCEKDSDHYTLSSTGIKLV